MKSLNYDSPRFDEMRDFLLYIYKIAIDNPNIAINHGMVYRELYKYGLSEKEKGSKDGPISCEHLFNKWKNRNVDNKNAQKGLSVIQKKDWKHFIQFFSINDYFSFQFNRDNIKLYIPIKYDNLYDDVNHLFDYICNAKIPHYSKITDIMRNDNIIVRVEKDDISSAVKIIDYVKTNLKKDSIGKTNPFVPTINGIGFTFDNGGSYNGELSDLIVSYIKRCVNDKNEPTLNEFINFVKANNKSQEVSNTFAYAIGEKKVINYDSEKKYANKINEDLLLDAIVATYQKYGINHTITAISKLVNDGNYNSFTNTDKDYRLLLKQKINPNYAKQIIKNTLNTSSNVNKNDVTIFCYKLFGNDLFKKIRNSCTATLEKYNYNQLKSALNGVFSNKDYTGFTRFSNNKNDETNYRELLSKIPADNFVDIVKLSLGINLSDKEKYKPDDLIPSFIDKCMLLNEGKNKFESKQRSR